MSEEKSNKKLTIKQLIEKYGIKISEEQIKKNKEDIDILTGKPFENND
jgi:hypothetical protein